MFYNPNIHPLQEYLRRREGVVQVAERLGIPVIFKDEEYDSRTYFRAVTFREAGRCLICYALRLGRTLNIARRGGFDCFTTTLLYSKFQKHEELRILGRDMACGPGPDFYYEDFRTGWSRGIALSKEWGIYRQQYCGCLYSKRNSTPPSCAPRQTGLTGCRCFCIFMSRLRAQMRVLRVPLRGVYSGSHGTNACG